MQSWGRRLRGGALAAGIAALPMAAAEAAPIVYATITGTVGATGIDNLGFFAVPGSSLGGEDFTLLMSFDFGVSNFQGTVNSSNADYRWLNGIAGVMGSMTINSRTVRFDSTGFAGSGGVQVADSSPSIGDLGLVRLNGNYNAQTLGVSYNAQVRSLLDNFILPPVALTSPFSYSYTTGPNTQFVSSLFQIVDVPLGIVVAPMLIETFALSSTGAPITGAFITQAPRLTNEPVAQVPEPAGYALLCLGLIGLGGVARRRMS